MGADTKIEWADITANFWEGCTQVSPACDNCYAKARAERFGTVEWNGPPRPVAAGAKVVRAAQRAAQMAWALHENAIDRHEIKGREAPGPKPRPPFIFVNSLSDFFDNQAQPLWRANALQEIHLAPNCVFLLLTKRIGNVIDMMDAAHAYKGFDIWPANAWLGITVINQEEANRDIPKLLAAKMALNIPKVFLSIEPMLGPIDLTAIQVDKTTEADVLSGWASVGAVDGVGGIAIGPGPKVDWVICGGESGKDARPVSIQWVRELRDQCAAAGVPFLFKQWGEWKPAGVHRSEDPGRFAFGDYEFDRRMAHLVDGYPRQFTIFGSRSVMERVGKKAAGRLLDGVEHNGRPEP